jgi:hypothetical protein
MTAGGFNYFGIYFIYKFGGEKVTQAVPRYRLGQIHAIDDNHWPSFCTVTDLTILETRFFATR